MNSWITGSALNKGLLNTAADDDLDNLIKYLTMGATHVDGALRNATHNGAVKVVNYLLTETLSRLSQEALTDSLTIAASRNYFEIVRRLSDLTQIGDLYQPLLKAAENGSSLIIEHLIKKEKGPSQRLLQSHIDEALIVACRYGNVDTVLILINLGARYLNKALEHASESDRQLILETLKSSLGW